MFVHIETQGNTLYERVGGEPFFFTLVERFYAGIEQDALLRVLIDETELGPGFVGPADIGRFVGAWKRSAALRSTRIAVFTSNLAIYGLNRMFQGLANAEGQVRVFRDRAPALAWLNDEPGP